MSAAVKLFSVMNLGSPVGNEAWTNYAKFLLEKVTNVALRNTREAATEVFKENKEPGDPVVNACASLDCSCFGKLKRK